MRVFVDMHWGGTVALTEALLDREELFADETCTIFAAAPPRENPRCRLGWATYEEDIARPCFGSLSSGRRSTTYGRTLS